MDTHDDCIEIVMRWGETVLDVVHRTTRAGFSIEQMPVVLPAAHGADRPRVVFPAGASGRITLGDVTLSLEELVARGAAAPCAELAGACSLPLACGGVAILERGALSFVIRRATGSKAAEVRAIRRRKTDARAVGWAGASLVVHALFVVACHAALPTDSPYLRVGLLDPRAARMLLDEDEPSWMNAAASRAEAGAHGDAGMVAVRRRRADVRADLARESRTAGILGALRRSPSSSVDPEPDAYGALHALMGDRSDESGGFGMIGTGRGGACGPGVLCAAGTVGLGNLGTIGHGAPARHRGRRYAPRARGSYGGGGSRVPSSQPTTPAFKPLPSSGVLASSFIAGNGVTARLSDLLERGVPVGGRNVRVEAFGRTGPLPYPIPSTEAVALYAEAERTLARAGGDTVHVQVALVARQGEAPPRPRMDVRIVLDRSWSMMEDDKWPQAIRAAHAVVDRLAPTDTIGIVAYAGNATLALAPRARGDGVAAHRAIGRIHAGDGTNIEDALQLVASPRVRPQRRAVSDVCLVLLVSDGQANVGVADPATLAAMARSLFDASGTLTTTIGLGAGFDEETMLSIAREGSGSYHFIRRPEDTTAILTDELEARATAVAQALRLRIELGPGVVARKVYGSRLLSVEEHAAVRRTEVATDRRLLAELGIDRDRAREEERGLRMHFPTFRLGDRHVVLLELDVPPGRAGSLAGLARITLDHKDLFSRSNARAVRSVSVEREDDRARVAESVHRPVKRTVLAFQAGEALQGAAQQLERGDLREARRALDERAALLRAASVEWRDGALARDATLLDRYVRVIDRAWPGLASDDQRALVLAMSAFGDERMR